MILIDHDEKNASYKSPQMTRLTSNIELFSVKENTKELSSEKNQTNLHEIDGEIQGAD